MNLGAVRSPAASVAAAQDRLGETGRRVARVARRGRRLALYAWAALFTVGFGTVLLLLLLLLVPVTTVTTSASGTSTATTIPAWGAIVSFAPTLALLLLAVREIVVGRREILEDRPTAPDGPTVFETANPSWIDAVRRAQEAITKTATSVEWSFVPFALALISVITYLVSEYSVDLAAGSPGNLIAIPAFGLLASILPLWLAYRAAKQWMRACQDDFERQADEMSRLEAEFLWRFTGSAA